MQDNGTTEKKKGFWQRLFDKLDKKMEEMRLLINEDLPNYCKIQEIKIFPEEFEKTPKRSIKRYLYQRTDL